MRRYAIDLPLRAASRAYGGASVALALVGASACSYIFELPATDVSATTPDAAADVVDAAADVIVAPDAPPIEAAAPFCASRKTPSLFCFDFDGEPPPDLATLGPQEVRDGRVEIANVVSVSPPRALLATVSGADASASVVHALGVSPDAVTFSFELLVSAWSSSSAQLSYIELTNGPVRCFVRLDGSATTWSVVQLCSTSGMETAKVVTDTGQPIVRGRWQRFSFALKLAPTKTVTLDIDDARVVGVPALDAMTPAPMSITLGIDLSATGTIALFHDNVLVTSP